MSPKTFACIVIVTIGAMLTMARIQNRPETEQERTERMENWLESEAVRSVKRLIEDGVKCPSTIKYVDGPDAGRNKEKTGWWVFAEFDCQNPMGAMVRAKAYARFKGDSFWEPEHFHIETR
jgi:hypothetical protein